MQHFTPKKVSQLFSLNNDPMILSEFKPSTRQKQGLFEKDLFTIDDVQKIGECKGFFKRPQRPMVMTFFTTKGGVFKTTLALNVARMSALHNIRTCIVGLDVQGDITLAMGVLPQESEEGEINDVLNRYDEVKGIYDIFTGRSQVSQLLLDSDIPGLKVIPETPELVAMADAIAGMNRREYWLKEKVIAPLKLMFDLIIIDCSPNWNRLTTNALMASDILVSPLECKINNFRNLKIYRRMLEEFQNDMQIDLPVLFVPTRYAANKKLSCDIRDWYQSNLEQVSPVGIRESTAVEESMALRVSLLEHRASGEILCEMKQVLSWLASECLSRSEDVTNINSLDGQASSLAKKTGISYQSQLL